LTLTNIDIFGPWLGSTIIISKWTFLPQIKGKWLRKKRRVKLKQFLMDWEVGALLQQRIHDYCNGPIS
jgi:hypothetical protein